MLSLIRCAGPAVLMCLAFGNARAQDTARSTPTDTAARRATIVLRASASAREVRFAAQPTIRVHLLGADFDSVHVLERRNLPDTVQPGVTYRDVYIAVEILGHLNTQCLLQRMGVAAAADSSWHDYCARAGEAPPGGATQPSPPRTP